MAVKIRLQRHGKKGKPFYWIVAADSRAKRDGKYLQKLGVYDPNQNPARVEVNIDQALKWLQDGAIPTNTARTLLSYRGVMLKHHLNKGVLKGAFKQEKADEEFQAWIKEKESKISAKQEKISKEIDKSKADKLKLEKELNQKRVLDRENAANEAAANEAAAKEESPKEEASVEEAPKAEVTAQEPPKEEAPAVEPPKEEASGEESSKEETSAEESSIEETPAEEAPKAEAPVDKDTSKEDDPK